jgi:DMSO/TMAO reductase YedYZ molybdopterin-dependent catalytic subunit
MTIPKSPLPPGQVATDLFPIVGEKQASGLPSLEDWRLLVTGLVDSPLELTFPEVLALPQKQLESDIHCVTGWTHRGMRFIGTPLAELLAIRSVAVRPTAKFVRFLAYSDRHHDTTIPVERALEETWLVHSYDGQPLAPEHGYPLRTVTPSRYFYKSVKWIHTIEFLNDDNLGYWERESAYHNNADPWPGDERYITGSVDPAKITRFLNASNYAPFRGSRKLLLSVDLQNWAPSTLDLGNLHLKNCDIRKARLDGVNLRGANLTRSRLDGASLRHADLTGADLEGASFVGADLTGANLSGTALCATRFVAIDQHGNSVGATIEGLQWDGATGLLEDQKAYLSSELNRSNR